MKHGVAYVLRAMHKYGMPVTPSHLEQVAWNGRTLNLDAFCGGPLDVMGLWHELGHWLTSTPKARKRCEYGQGAGNETYDFDLAFRDRLYACSLEEEKMASIAGIVVQRQHDPTLAWVRHLEEHSWSPGEDDLAVTYARLVKRGVFTDPGIPESIMRDWKRFKTLRRP